MTPSSLFGKLVRGILHHAPGSGTRPADQVAHLLTTLPIEFVGVDIELAKKGAELKATKKMSYADCFAAALAQFRKAELVTGDKEFKKVEGALKILWVTEPG